MTTCEQSTSGEAGESIASIPVTNVSEGVEGVGGLNAAAAQEDLPNDVKVPSETVHNILLLGESGVGKSTFINAFINYLTYGSLDEARVGEMKSLIYSEFSTCNENFEQINVAIGDPDDAEGGSNKKVGGSCTQQCKDYKFKIEESRTIRLIDTPGIGDTRGFDQDVKNIKDIVSYISKFEVLHAVCILLKPNEERLTFSLSYCIVELLSHLHKDASSNILFCFTNSRSTNYRPGGSLNLLKTLLSESPQTAAIKLDRSTMYCFDSEAFRFLAAVKNKVRYAENETASYSSSWMQSTEEAFRLIDHIQSLTPHDIQSTVSLNRVRDMLARIDKPLGEISLAIQSNLEGLREVMKDLLDCHGTITEKVKSLIIKENGLEAFDLGHLRTICSQPSCKGECQECGCARQDHMRVSHETRTVVREREDLHIRKVIDEKTGEIDKKNEVRRILQSREETYKDELNVVLNAAALFAGYLEQHSIVTYHTATHDYLKDQIKKTRQRENTNTDEARARIEELEGLLETYERQVRNFKCSSRSISSEGIDITEEDLKAELEKLYALKVNGATLRKLMQDVEREYKWAASRSEVSCTVVPPPAPMRPIGAAASPYAAGQESAPKSLFARFAGMTYAGQKKSGNTKNKL